ncbi:MAG: hypothetical protein ACQEQU_02375 [Spirochaetota bacterium]
MINRIMLTAMAVLLLSTGCVSYYAGERYGESEGGDWSQSEQPEGVTAPVFYGYGTGATRDDAEVSAVKDALVRASLLALREQAAVYQEKVELLFARSSRIDSYILSSSVDLVDWDYDRGTYEAIVSVRPMLPELSRLLRANDISGALVADNVTLRMKDQNLPNYDSSTPLSQVLPPVGGSWETGGRPTFLVYYDESQVSDPFTARAAVLTANDFLSSMGFDYVDLNQIEALKQDQEYAFAEETGQSSMIRWIASRLHADYYIDVSVSTSSYARGGSYYGEATTLLNCFESSTAAGRGSMFIQSEDPIKAASRTSAVDKAVAQGVTEGMKGLMEKLSEYLAADAQKGTAYDLVIMKTYQDRVMRTFEDVFSQKTQQLSRNSFSPEETHYKVVFNGQAEQLIEAVYESAELIPELEGMYLLYQRGNSLSFHSGW